MRYDGQRIEPISRSAVKRSPVFRANLNRLNSAETVGTNCFDSNAHYLYRTTCLNASHAIYDTCHAMQSEPPARRRIAAAGISYNGDGVPPTKRIPYPEISLDSNHRNVN